MKKIVDESIRADNGSPLISVIIPIFNREAFIGEAIESVLAQSEPDWELLLVDDGSTDRSVQIVEEYIEKFPSKIRLFTHENNENKGASASRKLGVEWARGEFLTFLDSDDVLVSDALAREREAFTKNPAVNAVCGSLECWFSWSDEADNTEKDFTIDLMIKPGMTYRPPDLLVHNLKAGGRKPGINCVMVRTDFARKVEVFEEDYNHVGEDQVFWAKVSLHSPIFVIDHVLAKYRQHPASTCAVESLNGQDTPSANIYLDWLEEYLKSQNIEDEQIFKAIAVYRRNVALESRVLWLKQLYREKLSLKMRYGIRNKWIGLKQLLSRSSHRHK